jgi:hypothetical protein
MPDLRDVTTLRVHMTQEEREAVFARTNAARARLALFLIGPERSEGPSLARRRHPLDGCSQLQAETTPANRGFCSGDATAGGPEHGALDGGGGS